MFGGNSNWRGPVWFPINIMLVRALMNLHGYFGDQFTVECPTGSRGHRAQPACLGRCARARGRRIATGG